MKIINLTPHDVKVLDAYAARIVGFYPRSGMIARVNTFTALEAPDILKCDDNPEVPFYITAFLNTEFLPAPKKDVYYIVSSVVKAANPERNDLLVPHDLVRNEDGAVIGCRGLALQRVAEKVE